MEGFQTTQLDILFFNSLFSTLFIKISIPDQDKNVRRDLKYKVVSIPLFRPKVDILSFKKKLQSCTGIIYANAITCYVQRRRFNKFRKRNTYSITFKYKIENDLIT